MAVKEHTLRGTVLIVRTVQNLVNDGWEFTGEGDDIKYAEHKDEEHSIFFGSPNELKSWLYKQSENY